VKLVVNLSAETLLTDNLVICPFDVRHLTQEYVDWLNDKQVVRFSEQRHKIHSLESCSVYWQSIKNSPSILWAIETCNNLHIGNITAHFDFSNSSADIGILIGNKTYWGKGYGCEAFSKVCEFLLSHSKIRKVTAGTMASNLGMRKIMMKSGMIEDGIRKRHFLLDGQEVDLIFAAKYSPNE
jgi:RimJ/RimL family protein N-acetyltransferase